MAPLIGRRYRIEELIGTGGMGDVYRAYDTLTDTKVALKRVRPHTEKQVHHQTTSLEHSRMSLAQEFRLLSGLRHPQIVSVLDYGFDDAHQPYFTMELIQDARNLLELGHHHTPQQRITLLVQVLQALTYLHHRSIIHRDLKPGNILITSDQQVKVLDFGLSIQVGQLKDIGAEIAGTMTYIAPEVLQGGEITPLSDLYSLGVVAYELLVGQHPFDHPDMVRMLFNTMNNPPDMSRFADDPVLANTSPIIQKLLEKSPANRYQNADLVISALCAAAKIPVPVENSLMLENYFQAAQFVGRETELQTLTDQLEAAMEGQGSICLIGGESGVGKSRLAEELRTIALVKGAMVLRGQVLENSAQLYQLWRTPLRSLLRLSPHAKIDAAILKDVIPDIDQVTGFAPPGLPLLEGQARLQRLNSAVIELLHAQQQPLVLILDDLHWIAESLGVLKAVAEIVSTLPVMIVGTFRTEERPELPKEIPQALFLPLDRLKDGAIADLCTSMLGREDVQPYIIDFLRQETEGNPFFIVEVMRILAQDAGNLAEVGTHTLPAHVFAGGMRQVIQRRLARVPATAYRLLQIAAVVGRQIDLQLMKLLDSTTHFDEWLTLCVNAAVIDSQDNQWRFTHDKLREFILAEMSEDQRHELHQRIAEAYACLPNAETNYAEALTYHWMKAENITQEAHYLLLAGEAALKTGAYARALGHFERRLALEEKLPTLPRSRAWQYLSDVYFAMGNYPMAQRILSENIAKSDQGLARAHNILGNIALAFGEYEEAQQQLEKSIAIARRANDLLELGKAMRSLGVVIETRGDHRKAKFLYQESISHLTVVDDLMGIAGAFANLATIARHEGDYPEAKRLYQAALVKFAEIRFEWGQAYTLTSLGITHLALEELDAAENCHQQALTICKRIGHKWGMAYCQSNLVAVYLTQQDWTKAEHYLVNSLRIVREIQTIPLMLDLFTHYARLQSAEKSAQILQFVIHHKSVDADTVNIAAQQLAKLKLSDEALETAKIEAEKLDIESIATEILNRSVVV